MADRGQLFPLVETEGFELIRYSVKREGTIGFQGLIGLSGAVAKGLCVCPIPLRDMPLGSLLLGQMRGRGLSVATSRLGDPVSVALASRVQ
ncbi:hypothetical protein [Thetidibacter halocola]|uniref:Uncharacterized protein n=1 Tax=Thetidibacter halocola TaxID=2827239 RepID=A0A8J7WKR2_9RHOB|nr:hypothetical protein [Thetidibacter halocola]MBS0126804.1 hypothetical protein [Thetidibacter halocola]